MRWTISVAGILSLFFAAIFVYSGVRASSEDQSEQAIREALKAQLKSVAVDLEESIGRSVRIAEDVSKIDSKDKASARSLLEQIEAPEMVIIGGGKNVIEWVAPKYARTIPAAQAMHRHLKGESVWAFWQDLNRKSYVLYHGKKQSRKGEVEFVALYYLESVFSRMAKGGAIRPWVALSDGHIVHHSESRHVGQKAANVRPVALGKQNISKDNRTEMIAKYVGLEGYEVLGTWATLPALQMIIGTEWPADWWGRKSGSYLTWLAAIFFFIGAVLIGYAITPKPILVTEVKNEFNDLSHEARSFIRKAEREVARAYEYARDREEEASSLESQAREQLGYVKRTRWIFEKTDSFLDEVMEAPIQKDVWKILARNLSNMAWKSPVLIFSHSNATHSLVPEIFLDRNKFTESANRYLNSARILIGDSRSIVGMEKNNAYEAWMKRLQKHLAINNWRIFHLPFASQTGSKGVVLFFIRPEVFDGAEISRQRDLWNLFAHRAAWLYDLKRRLIQSTYESRRKKQQNLAEQRSLPDQ